MNLWLLLPGSLGLDPFKVPWLRMTKLRRAVHDELYADPRGAPLGVTG